MASSLACPRGRAFQRVPSATYGGTERHRIMFGQYAHTPDADTFEMGLVWHDLDGSLHLRLESFADSWMFLGRDERLREMLRHVGEEIHAGRRTPSVGRVMLDLRAAGFEDQTPPNI